MIDGAMGHVRDWVHARSPALRRALLNRARTKSETGPRRLLWPNRARPALAASDTFATSDGRRLAVLGDHRYRLVQVPSYIPEIVCLHTLDRWGALTHDDRRRFRDIIGERTLTVPVHDARQSARTILAQYAQHLVPGSLEASAPAARPNDTHLATTLKAFVGSHRILIERAAILGGCRLPDHADILEIGYSSGGHSVFAFERLGHRVCAIDSAYDGIAARPALHNHLAERLNSRATFAFGDISATAPFESRSFDLIFSISVIEHIADLPSAFREMHRLLKPGGFLMHRYNPFFSANGGHSWGLLDCPWGHLRVTLADHLRYLDEMRPNEAAVARDWTKKTLNRKANLGQVQRWLVEAGFHIALWEDHPESQEEAAALDANDAAEILAIYPEVGLTDILTREVIFVAA